jgi:hypothetical protein
MHLLVMDLPHFLQQCWSLPAQVPMHNCIYVQFLCVCTVTEAGLHAGGEGVVC